MDKKISDKVINRLTLYHCILTDFIDKNIEYISSKQIAELLHIDDSQVRKDINLLNNSGKSRIGYIAKEFRKSEHIFIMAHKDLDLDAIGSSIGMYMVLKKLKKH